LWLLSLPVALPGVVALDLMMLFTSVMVRHKGKGANSSSGSGGAAVLSSFLSNYNFTRLFLEFVCESVPQTVLQVRRVRPHLHACMRRRGLAHHLFDHQPSWHQVVYC
jgi:hypothetical protein